MRLTDTEKLLYDSCEDFAKCYISNRGDIIVEDNECGGNQNILELCNRCPLYIPDYENSQNNHLL